ncbi:uncharacterized protein LOC135502570 [Lineus longissimus]|uniref:uncharacterized protein LOC135502570 n=1 Tax=Lineus longissimus TaxID=88925 RepID=UPI00315D4184
MYHFGYLGMKSRLQLAGLHFNENSGRDQAKLKNGEEQFNISFPKFKKGDFSVKRVLTKCTFNYVTELQKEVCRIIRAGEICQNEEPPHPHFPVPSNIRISRKPSTNTGVENATWSMWGNNLCWTSRFQCKLYVVGANLV